MSDDLIMAILAELGEDTKEAPNPNQYSELAKPIKGDAVFSRLRQTRGQYGGGVITDIDYEEDEYTVCWWDPADKGILMDSDDYERYDFAYFKDGKAGRCWYLMEPT